MSNIAEKTETAELSIGGKSYTFPVITGTENEKAIDISKLRDETGLITLDIGYKNTGATQSAITFLDGELGILRYRGYSIEELAEKADFLEVAYLLIYGELPKAAELAAFEADVKANMEVPKGIQALIESYPADAHPMGILSSAVVALHAHYPDCQNPNMSDADRQRHMKMLLGKLPTICAWIYRRQQGLPYVAPDASLDYCGNFLKMMYSKPGENYTPDQRVVAALDKLLILHADHEQNCSTSTTRIVGSSKANLYASVSAGICALWGPLHGGANQEVIEMLEEVRADGGDIAKTLAKAKDKNSGFRLMGFGHRVYKNFDPRARIIKVAADDVLHALGINDPVLDIAKGLEQAALTDPYFVDRKLYPNVDFYSGIIYRALGIPTGMFTVMFALGRLPGWMSQWRELLLAKEPIGRPRQVYTGATLRPFVAKENR
jgi:citrate synthase